MNVSKEAQKIPTALDSKYWYLPYLESELVH